MTSDPLPPPTPLGGGDPYGDIEWDSPEELARRILEHIDREGHGRNPGDRT